MVVFNGPVYHWQFKKSNRAYGVVTLPFGEARKHFKSNLYNASSGEGVQRQVFPAHVRNLKRDMVDDKYTPCAIAVGISQEQLKNLTNQNGQFELELSDNEHLSLLNGGHRFAALERLLEEGNSDVLNVPVTALLHLDGRNKHDFLNLQKGRAVDKAHMLSLQSSEGLVADKFKPLLKFALSAAQELNTNPASPFCKMIKFDSCSMAPLPVSTLCSRNGSDLGTSLLGGAKIALKAGKTPLWLAEEIIHTYTAVKSKHPEVLEVGRVLTPPPDGTKGGATMWLGLGNMLAYWHSLPDSDQKEAINQLLHATKKVFDVSLKGGFAGPKKRELLGEFAYTYFAGLSTVEFYNDEVPQDLVDLFGYSTFNLKKPAKVKKKRGRKPKSKTSAVNKKKTVEPEVLSDNIVEESPSGEDIFPWQADAPWEVDEVEA